MALLEYRGDMLPIPMHKEGILHHFRDIFLSLSGSHIWAVTASVLVSSFGYCLPIGYPRSPAYPTVKTCMRRSCILLLPPSQLFTAGTASRNH